MRRRNIRSRMRNPTRRTLPWSPRDCWGQYVLLPPLHSKEIGNAEVEDYLLPKRPPIYLAGRAGIELHSAPALYSHHLRKILTSESEETMSKIDCCAANPLAKKLVFAIIVVLLGISTALAQNNPDPLKSGFENPPAGARPRVWWHRSEEHTSELQS